MVEIQKETKKELLFYLFILVICLVSLLACLYALSKSTYTPTETTLIGVLQTIFSLCISWLLTYRYASQDFQKRLAEENSKSQTNLKNFALKASEKVSNLSNELTRLSTYLQQELSIQDETAEDGLFSKKEKMRSAIHIIDTLKSINDGSLSDWKGVIPEEIKELEEVKKELEEEKEEEEKEKLERLDNLYNRYLTIIKQTSDFNTSENNGSLHEDDFSILTAQVAELKEKIDDITSQTLGPIKRKEFKSNKQEISKNCPECSHEITYKQRAKSSSIKKIICPSCHTDLFSIWSQQSDFQLLKNQEVPEFIYCLKCQKQIDFSLKTKPAKSKLVKCDNCKSTFKVTRYTYGIQAEPIEEPKNTSIEKTILNLNEELIEQIKNELPEQPWPQGTSQEIAKRTQIPLPTVRAAIDELIKRGDFKFQFQGKLYTPFNESEGY